MFHVEQYNLKTKIYNMENELITSPIINESSFKSKSAYNEQVYIIVDMLTDIATSLLKNDQSNTFDLIHSLLKQTRNLKK